jgi:hypothetical protein
MRQRDALNTGRRKLPTVEIDQEYDFPGPGRPGQPARPVPGPWSTADQPFHVRPGLGPGLRILLIPSRRHQPPRPPARPGHHAGHGQPGAAARTRGIPAADGLDRAWYSCSGSDFNRVFHTCSSYARGTGMVNSTSQWLDLTARGRQQDREQPPGRSDGPLLSWLRHHDRYGA